MNNRPDSDSNSNAVPADATASHGTQAGTHGGPPRGLTPPGALPTSIGGYTIQKLLGEGGMGAVYLARDEKLNREVALKTMRAEIASLPSAVERFLREARAIASVTHDHIIPIYQVGEDNGQPFIAMPLLEGEPLDKFLEREPLPHVTVILKLGRQTAEGLAAAHKRGLIHRDIKPANLWIEGEPNSPNMQKRFHRVKILDFGLARPATEDTQLTNTGAVVGTPAYMSPEQARGKTVDARTDIFSLGVVLYQMATGTRPFNGPNQMAVLMSLGTETPDAPHTLNTETPRVLSDYIMRMLEKDPAKRPASADEVANDLREFTKQLAAARKAGTETAPASVPMAQPANISQSLPVVVYPQQLLQPVEPQHNPFTEFDATELPRDDVPTATVDDDENAAPARKKKGKGIWALAGIASILAVVAVVIAVGKLGKNDDPQPPNNDVVKNDNKDKEKDKGKDKDKGIPPKPKDKVPLPPEPDRVAAEWVVSVGGTVALEDRGDWLKDVKQFPAGKIELKRIMLTSCRETTDENMARFRDCTNLLDVGLNGSSATDVGLANFKNAKGLQVLSLNNVNIGDAALLNFQDHHKLYSVVLNGTLVSDKGIESLLRNSELGTLEISKTQVTDASVEHISKFKKLQHLNVRDTKVTREGVEKLAVALPQCRIVWSGGTVEPKSKTEREIIAWALEKQMSVKVRTDASEIELRQLTDLPPVPFVVTWIEGGKHHVMTDGDLAMIGQLKGLVRLYFRSHLATDAGMKHLSGLTNLEFLSPGVTQCTNDSLALFSKLPKLEYLDTSFSNYTDAALVHLKDYPSLTTLHLFNTKITDAGLEHLKKVRKLNYLSLNGTAVTDAGLVHLHEMPALRTVNLTGTKVTPDGIAKLKQAIPNCNVIYEAAKPVSTREIAEWVFSLGGSVYITTKDRGSVEVRGANALPPGEPVIEWIYLNSQGGKVTDAECVKIKSLKNLAKLSINATAVTDTGLQHLSELQELTFLDITGTKITDAGLIHLKAMTKLEHLHLPSTTTDVGLANLAGLNNLTFLFASCPKITDAGLIHLRDLTQLKKLILQRTAIQGTGFQHLKKLTALDEFDLLQAPLTGVGLEHLKTLPKLRRLILTDTKINDAGLGQLSAFPSLEYLLLTNTAVGDGAVEFLAKCSKLKMLSITNTKLSPDGFAKLRRALPDCAVYSDHNPNIRPIAEWVYSVGGKVTIRIDNGELQPMTVKNFSPNSTVTQVRLDQCGGKVTDDDMKRLKELPDLTAVFLYQVPITNDGLKHLKDLKGVKQLHLGGTKVTDDGIPLLAEMESLTTLHLVETAITEKGVEHLKKFPKLTSLYLSGTSIGDAGVAHLKDMKSLKLLDLSGTTVTDAGFANLKLLSELTDLRLQNTHITDASIDTLSSYTKLQSLTLSDTKITTAGIAKLKKALPKCGIIHVNPKP